MDEFNMTPSNPWQKYAHQWAIDGTRHITTRVLHKLIIIILQPRFSLYRKKTFKSHMSLTKWPSKNSPIR